MSCGFQLRGWQLEVGDWFLPFAERSGRRTEEDLIVVILGLIMTLTGPGSLPFLFRTRPRRRPVCRV